MIAQRQEWKTIMEWANQNEWTTNVSHNCAVEQMIQDGYEEIGSSDINHIIYGRLQDTTKDTIFQDCVEWAKELGIL